MREMVKMMMKATLVMAGDKAKGVSKNKNKK